MTSRERIEIVTEGGRTWIKVDGTDIAGHVLQDRCWVRFEDGVPIVRVEMVGDLTAILDMAKVEVIPAGLTCGADITHRDEEHRQSVCILMSGHEGSHDDGQGCVWTGGNQ